MRTLPETFKSDGFTFKLLRRQGQVALFSKRKPEHSREFYEVVIIKRNPTQTVHGQVVEAWESMPGSEQWGLYGWSYSDLPAAESRFSRLLEAQGSTSTSLNPENGSQQAI